jgi:hypothetical protein
MVCRIGRNIQMMWVFLFSILMSTPVWAQQAGQPAPWPGAAHPWFIYAVVVVVLGASLLALVLIRAALSASKWSLADALSEEVEVTATQEESGVVKLEPDEDGKPVMIKKMGASTSRLIALMGMVVILLMFLGFGAFVLYAFGKTGELPNSMAEVVKFLVAGLVLFAPYVANKFATMFESLSTPKKA